MIFVRTVPRCVALNLLLQEQAFPSICIHRGMAQEERLVTRVIVTDFNVVIPWIGLHWALIMWFGADLLNY